MSLARPRLSDNLKNSLTGRPLEINSPNCYKCNRCSVFKLSDNGSFKCCSCRHNIVYHQNFDTDLVTSGLISEYFNPSPIVDNIFMGCYKSQDTTDLLDKFNIGYIINCAYESTKNMQQYKMHPQIKYLNLIIDDSNPNSLELVVNEATEFICLAQKNSKNILVHCLRGINRSGCLIAAHLIKHKKLNHKTALDTVKNGRKFFTPNKQFTDQLLIFEQVYCMGQ